MTLQNIIQINQPTTKEIYRFAIQNKNNVLCLGPSGAGKTEMAFQVCYEMNKIPIYWNLSVGERVDIQGLPKIEGDVSVYAAPQQLPIRNNKEKYDIRKFLSLRQDSYKNSLDIRVIRNYLSKQFDDLEAVDNYNIAKNVCAYIKDPDVLEKLLKYIDSIEYKNAAEYVLIFDEADKAPPEVLQPLLEILQFRTINGAPLNIQGCILTANLPDEHVHSEQISHAITNRCMVVELAPDIKEWLEWGKYNNIHPLIIGFLSREDNDKFFHRRPKQSELYTYTYPTPRGWTDSSTLLYSLEQNQEYGKDFRYAVIASRIGDEAAKKFKIWTEYYFKLDPVIDYIFENGIDNVVKQLDFISASGDKVNTITQLPFDEQLICAIGVCSKYMRYVESTDDGYKLESKTKLIFNWLALQDKEIQTTALQSTLKANVLRDKHLSKIPEAHKVFMDLKLNYEKYQI